VSLDSGQQCHPVINVSTSKQGPQLGQQDEAADACAQSATAAKLKGTTSPLGWRDVNLPLNGDAAAASSYQTTSPRVAGMHPAPVSAACAPRPGAPLLGRGLHCGDCRHSDLAANTVYALWNGGRRPARRDTRRGAQPSGFPAFQRLIGDRRKTANAGPLAVRWPQAESTNNILGNRVNALVRLSRPNGSQWKMMLGFEQANDKKEQIMKATTSTLLALSALILALAGSNSRWQRWAARDATAERTIDDKECAPSSPSQCT
jgi:hypothetical protein